MARWILRSQWGPQGGRGSPLSGPLSRHVVHHQGVIVDHSLTVAQIIAVWRAIERYHLQVRGWQGIGYSWGVFRPDINIEGRGWLRSGAHTQGGLNYTAHGQMISGNTSVQGVSQGQWDASRELIGEGIRVRAIAPSPTVTGHRDHHTTACPGDAAYAGLHRLRGITGPGSAPAPAPPASEDEDVIPFNSRGGHVVAEIQWQLNLLRHGVKGDKEGTVGLATDGWFYNETRKEILYWQEKWGYPQTGEWDLQTSMRVRRELQIRAVREASEKLRREITNALADIPEGPRGPEGPPGPGLTPEQVRSIVDGAAIEGVIRLGS